MAIAQMEIIQSLGEAMAWFQKEIKWEVNIGELKHLTGRIGELYAALIVNGQMAMDTNQKGYDVVSKDGERISVKTTTQLGGSGAISFNVNTLDQVDRVMIFRINQEEMEIETLLDAPIEDVKKLMAAENGGVRRLAISKITKKVKKYQTAKIAKEVEYVDYRILELENGTIQIWEHGKQITPVLPILRKLANALQISITNDNGNFYNTRQLGSLVMQMISVWQPAKKFLSI